MNMDANLKFSKRKINVEFSAEKEEGEPDFFDAIFGAASANRLLEDEDDADLLDDID